MHDIGLVWDHCGITTGPPNIDADPEHVAWLNFNFEIKHSAYRKAGGMIANPRAVGSPRMQLPG
jgi:hypothetical protein